MQRLSHKRPGNVFSRALGVVGAILLVGVAFFLGLFFLAILLGLTVIGIVTFLARMWWLRRRLQKSQLGEELRKESNVLEGEYVIVERTTRAEIDEEKK